MIEYTEEKIQSIFQKIEELASVIPLNRKSLSELFSYRNMDLCIFLDSRYTFNLNPFDISPRDFINYQKKYLTCEESVADPTAHNFYKDYWICQDDTVIGNFSIKKPLGSHCIYLEVVSLYILPEHRKKGYAKKLLDTINKIVQLSGFSGILIGTGWIMQKNIRYYLKRNMWVLSWKRFLYFIHDKDLPAYKVLFNKDEASFSIFLDEWQVVYKVKANGEFLDWQEINLPKTEELKDQHHRIQATFSLHLAIHGFPLKRSKETWHDRYTWSDVGMPEGLAHKIEFWEYWERIHGFPLNTPKIPGLDYDFFEAHKCNRLDRPEIFDCVELSE